MSHIVCNEKLSSAISIEELRISLWGQPRHYVCLSSVMNALSRREG